MEFPRFSKDFQDGAVCIAGKAINALIQIGIRNYKLKAGVRLARKHAKEQSKIFNEINTSITKEMKRGKPNIDLLLSLLSMLDKQYVIVRQAQQRVGCELDNYRRVKENGDGTEMPNM